MFNNAVYQRIANQNYNEVSHWSEWSSSKNLQITIAGEDVEKGNPPTLLVGMSTGTATMENNMKVS